MMTLIEPKAFESISLGNRKVDGAQVTSSYADHWASHLVLKRALKSFGVSKYQLAKLLGVPQESANKYMNGATSPGSSISKINQNLMT